MGDGLRDRFAAAGALALHRRRCACGVAMSGEIGSATVVVDAIWPLIVADREQTRQDAYQQGRQDEAAAVEAERRRHFYSGEPFTRGYWNP